LGRPGTIRNVFNNEKEFSLKPNGFVKNIRIRKAVVEALNEIKSPQSIKPLEQTALNKKEMITIRLQAITALSEIENDETVSSLLSILKEVEAGKIPKPQTQTIPGI